MRTIALCAFLLATNAIFFASWGYAQSTSLDYASKLKTLSDKFSTMIGDKKDYQQLREIRAELKKLIPTIRGKADETSKLVQTEDFQLNSMKGSLSFAVSPPPPISSFLTPLPSGTRPFPANQFPFGLGESSVESLKRKIDDLKRSLPLQIEGLNKALDQNEALRDTANLAIAKTADETEKKLAQSRLQQLDQVRQSATSGLEIYQRQFDFLDEISRSTNDVGEREKALRDLKKEQSELQRLAIEAENLLDRLDERAQSILSNDNAQNIFTMISTISFAALVGTIIILFFLIANKSDVVRNAIFAGESGIQFVTLFSLVIAIILFGVLHILEGKELSALLGGLSGYILGRGSQQSQKPNVQNPPAPNPTPAPNPAG